MLAARSLTRRVSERLGTTGAMLAGMRGGTLVLDLGWFDFITRMRLGDIYSRPRLVPIALDHRAPPIDTSLQSPVDTGEVYGGAPLLETCLYDICVRQDRCVADVLDDSALDRLVARSFAEARALIDLLAQLLEIYRPRRVVYPQGYVLPAAILRHLATERGILCMAIENCFRADRFVWDDFAGVTLASRIPRSLYGTSADGAAADRYFADYLAQRENLKSDEHRNRGGGRLPEGSGRRILYLGQVSTDSSVLFHIGDGFRDQIAVMTCLVDHLEARHDDVILFKGHPKEAGGVTPVGTHYSTARYAPLLDRLAREHDPARFGADLDGVLDVFDAIAWADLCVTINSQSGLEAACLDKPVILCGEAAYDHLPSIHKVMTPSDLRRALSARDLTADGQSARCFFRQFCEDYGRPKTLIALRDLLRERTH